jgi:HPt (histidine-containing phosphotransfer) domain-containing protein
MIDWNRVRDLKNDMGSEGFDEVAELFAAEVEEALGALDPAAPAELFTRQLHALKGSALNLGFVTLAGMCAEGEARAAAGMGDTVPVAELRAVYRASQTAFAAGPEAGGNAAHAAGQ